MMRSMSSVAFVLVLVAAACGGGGGSDSTGAPTRTSTAATTATTGSSTAVQSGYWPTDGWRTSTPEEQGIDSEALTELIDYLQSQDGLAIHSLLIIRNGHVVTDAAFYPYPPSTLHNLESVTKSFTSTLIGIAIDQGHIESVDSPLLGFFPERTVANLDANKEAMTLANSLTMRSGFECSGSGGSTDGQMWASPDWVQFALDLPMATEPGVIYNYCNPNPHLLSAIIQETTGMSALAFAEEQLFEPLGIGDAVWATDPGGTNHGYGDLYLAPHDMAKLGYLFLNRGMWEDQQVVSAEWVEAATTSEQSRGYGYLWWLNPGFDFYWATGTGGQNIFVLPDQDMVVVTTGATGGGGTGGWGEQLLTSRIIPLAESAVPLPANPDGVAALEFSIGAAVAPVDRPEPVPPLPEVALQVDGRAIVLDPNPLGLQSSSLTFPEETEAVLTLNYADGNQVEWLIGLDNVERFFPLQYGLLAAAKGGWESGNVFAIQVDEIGNVVQQQIRLTFEGDQVTIEGRSQEGGGDNQVTLVGHLEK
jgi:CubicO group peptidase (beta-lactamase class C family)